MPSIKAVLVSLALSALALAPVAQASPVKGACTPRTVFLERPQTNANLTFSLPPPAADEVLARRSPSFAVEKRSESRKDLAARVKRAKLAAARKVKRQRTTWGQRAAAAAAAPATAAPVSAAPASSNGGVYSAGSPFLSTPQALAAAAVRCGSSESSSIFCL